MVHAYMHRSHSLCFHNWRLQHAWYSQMALTSYFPFSTVSCFQKKHSSNSFHFKWVHLLMTGWQLAWWLIALDNSATLLLVLTVAEAAISHNESDFHPLHVYCQSLLFIAGSKVSSVTFVSRWMSVHSSVSLYVRVWLPVRLLLPSLHPSTRCACLFGEPYL